jgi:hypothetical protein
MLAVLRNVSVAELKKEITIILQQCYSTKRNVSRDITASSITRSLDKRFLKILVHNSN